ncbi:DUF924 domain-containing protein [Natronospirillum operosum]|uniref:DUF924 domain-containing protein n=1 Tax=Natronospirillum operosum TaxID=2759953 RepID=A0A4Z0WCP0_9GAMM|nr:DUF924 family protein [Natronospirillum operosum]TGG91573.1 DUF924 domain-containing protein [Natronospirillum operosum]
MNDSSNSLAVHPDARAVLNFWYQELSVRDWFRKSDALDQTIQQRFGPAQRAASQGECAAWRTTPEGRLAEIIVLDQFSRNIFRDRPEAFASDGMALVLAQEAVGRGDDQRLPEPMQRVFLYMPYMHSESKLVHEVAMQLFAQPGLEENLGFEEKHKAIIDRFGRYPHRNVILGRESTPEEIEFLRQPGSSF